MKIGTFSYFCGNFSCRWGNFLRNTGFDLKLREFHLIFRTAYFFKMMGFHLKLRKFSLTYMENFCIEKIPDNLGNFPLLDLQ